ncbi:MAG: xanthine dehydrogenase molybdopterin binding subunit [Moritella sp.]|nr:MAG: xanthine dehydrogenase molybdopterin binding subunit [Moritella sp.]PHS77435.1 MAG: xanthine dehydrogenase molybdopterin binding subunit [Robiginitomaculum sp.]
MSVYKSIQHDSALKQACGTARYLDDIPEPKALLHMYIAMSTHAHAKIKSMDLSAVKNARGVQCVLSAKDIPGHNDVSPFGGDDPLFAESLVEYVGQPIFAVAATTRELATQAAMMAKIEYDALPAITTIEQARAADLTIENSKTITKGDAPAAIKTAPNRIKGSFVMGGQDHFYLEGMIAMALPLEDGDVHVYSSTQNPTEIQHLVAHVLGKTQKDVTVEVRRMGGGFGGKETQPAIMAAACAIAATKTGKAVKCRLDRDDDMKMTGKRHDFIYGYDCGFDDTGRIVGLDIVLESRCGRSKDLSGPINDRAMFHADNSYDLPTAKITSHRYKTHTVSNTAFRGFGGPQGMIGIERIIEDIAFRLGKDPLDVRLLNAYGQEPEKNKTNETPYGQTVEDAVVKEILEELAESSNYRTRRADIRAYNKTSKILKKGIAITPVKFGISFTKTFLNQAGALVHVYADGSVHLNHGGTEMGQGLFIKVAQVVAEEFKIPLEQIKISATRTDKVPNTSATAASSGSDLNGMAALNAARKIKLRLITHAAKKFKCAETDISFKSGIIIGGDQSISFADLTRSAYEARIQLSATGFYKTPKIRYNPVTLMGSPFYYYAYGAAVSEVIIDTLTGENKVTRVDILHDCGQSLNPAVDMGQIEGGFIQGMGWLTTEELVFDDAGHLKTHAPSTYKIPTIGDRPKIMNIAIWEKGRNREETIYRSKAVGEPPFMLANSVYCALADAVCASTHYKSRANLNAPCTPEEILRAVTSITDV